MAKSKVKAPPWRDRVLRLERVRAGDLAANPENWRRHPPAQVEALRGVLSEVGFAGALLAYQDDGKLTLIDGHLRAGLDPGAEVPVLVLDVDRDEARKLLATYDPLGAMAAPDQDALLSLLRGVDSQSQAVKDMLEALANGSYAPLMPMPNMESEAGLTDADDVPEVPAEPWVKRGDVFQLGEHRLMCGDSTKAEDVERLMVGERADFTFTDPPYNVGMGYTKETNDNRKRNDYMAWCKSWAIYLPIKHCLTVGIKRLVWWGDILGDPQWIIAWVKRNGQGQTGLGGTNKWDAILCYGVKPDGDTDIVEINNDYNEGMKSKGEHPTAKPVELWTKIINRFGGQLVYDPFLGSGTTLIACEKLGRKCMGIDIEPAYIQVALERWQNYTGRKAVKIDGNGHQG